MLKLHTLICSTRPRRVGMGVAQWFHGFAVEHGSFDAELVDLATFDLPVLDEPHHPRLQKYEHAHTKRWSASVREADAFVFVTPEYNYGSPPSLVNALDYLSAEWHYKPVGFVSYGGVSGGLRSVQMTKQIVTALRMMPIPEGVSVPAVSQQIVEGVFQATDHNRTAAAALLGELRRWADALKPLRV
jgi:NAD(P)H-dependent FMN reductase